MTWFDIGIGFVFVMLGLSVWAVVHELKNAPEYPYEDD